MKRSRKLQEAIKTMNDTGKTPKTNNKLISEEGLEESVPTHTMSTPQKAHICTIKNVQVGDQFLGVIEEVLDDSLRVSLPINSSGKLHITEFSDTLCEYLSVCLESSWFGILIVIFIWKDYLFYK